MCYRVITDVVISCSSGIQEAVIHLLHFLVARWMLRMAISRNSNNNKVSLLPIHSNFWTGMNLCYICSSTYDAPNKKSIQFVSTILLGYWRSSRRIDLASCLYFLAVRRNYSRRYMGKKKIRRWSIKIIKCKYVDTRTYIFVKMYKVYFIVIFIIFIFIDF